MLRRLPVRFALKGKKVFRILKFLDELVNPFKEVSNETLPINDYEICEWRTKTSMKIGKKIFRRSSLTFGNSMMDSDTENLKKHWKKGYNLSPCISSDDFSVWNVHLSLPGPLQMDETGSTYFTVDNGYPEMVKGKVSAILYRELHLAIKAMLEKAEDDDKITLIREIPEVKVIKFCPYNRGKCPVMSIPMTFREKVVTSKKELKLLDSLLRKTEKGIATLIREGRERFDKKNYEGAFENLVMDTTFNPIKANGLAVMSNAIDLSWNDVLIAARDITKADADNPRSKKHREISSHIQEIQKMHEDLLLFIQQ